MKKLGSQCASPDTASPRSAATATNRVGQPPSTDTSPTYASSVPATDSVPALAVLPFVKGLTVGSAVLGTVFLAVVIVLSDNQGSALISALVAAVVFGLLTWFPVRGRQMRMWGNADVADRISLLDTGPAFRRGLLLSLFLTLAEAAVVTAFALAWGFEGTEFVGGLVLGFAFSQGLGSRDLRRWQEADQSLLCQRVDGRRIAWTLRQAQSRLLVVPTGRTSDGPPPTDLDKHDG